MTNFVVGQKIQVKVSNGSVGSIITPENPVTLKTVPTLTSVVGATTMGQLRDVDLQNEVDGGSLVYHADTNTFVVRAISFDVGGGIDGGEF